MVSLGWAGLDPAHSWDETSSLGVSIPYTNLGQVSAHPNEAMNSIKLLQQTAALLSVSHGIMPSRPPLLSFGVRHLRGKEPELVGTG